MRSETVEFLLFLALSGVSALLVALMARHGVLDLPEARKSHDRPIPKGGGVGIVAAGLLGLVWAGGPVGPRLVLAGGGLLLALVGYADDHRDFPPAVKFSAQIFAALLPVLAGLTPRLSGVFALDAAITVGWILLVTHAVNFMDGLNGLAAGVGAMVAVVAGAPGLLAGLCGFLPFNYPRARIFMGDVGSQFLGYALALLGVWGWGSAHPWLVPMMLSGLLADVVFTLIRRAANGDQLTQAHRSHLYQIAQRSGVPAAALAPIHWGFAGWGAVIGLGPFSLWSLVGVLVPQLAWLVFVVRRERRHPVGRW